MIVLDANAAMAVAMGTEAGGTLEALQVTDERIAAPQLMFAEVSHVLSKYIKGDYMSTAEAVACGQDALMLVDDFYEDSTLWVEALTESVRLGHSTYDLFYLVLARRLGATLFTLDKKLQALCAQNGVNCIWITGGFTDVAPEGNF